MLVEQNKTPEKNLLDKLKTFVAHKKNVFYNSKRVSIYQTNSIQFWQRIVFENFKVV
jgi:hypothetical protein